MKNKYIFIAISFSNPSIFAIHSVSKIEQIFTILHDLSTKDNSPFPFVCLHASVVDDYDELLILARKVLKQQEFSADSPYFLGNVYDAIQLIRKVEVENVTNLTSQNYLKDVSDSTDKLLKSNDNKILPKIGSELTNIFTKETAEVVGVSTCIFRDQVMTFSGATRLACGDKFDVTIPALNYWTT